MPVALVALATLGCSKSDSADDTRDSVSEALTHALMFPNGKVVHGSMPPATTDEIMVMAPSRAVVDVAPGGSGVVQLTVTGKKIETDPIVATLLQFDKAPDFITVPGTPINTPAMPGTGVLGSSFTLGSSVCANQCNTVHMISYRSAVLTMAGLVSAPVLQTFSLDCRTAGVPARCVQGAPGVDNGTTGSAGVTRLDAGMGHLGNSVIRDAGTTPAPARDMASGATLGRTSIMFKGKTHTVGPGLRYPCMVALNDFFPRLENAALSQFYNLPAVGTTHTVGLDRSFNVQTEACPGQGRESWTFLKIGSTEQWLSMSGTISASRVEGTFIEDPAFLADNPSASSTVFGPFVEYKFDITVTSDGQPPTKFVGSFRAR